MFVKSIRLKSKKGFTLPEILIYIVVLSIIIIAITNVLDWAIKTNAKDKVLREVSDNGRRIMEILNYEIREAKSVYTPTSNSSQLSLETTHYLPSNETISFIDFYLCGADLATLCLKKESQNPISISSERIKIDSLSFQQISGSSSVQINLQISFRAPNNRPEYQASLDLTSTVSLRNY